MTGQAAIVTGASRGIGAGLVAGYRRQGWAVVTSARTITPSEDPGVLTVTGDIADAEIADRIIGGALRRFGRIDTLVNSAGVFTAKPFTGCTAADYARVAGGSLTGFFWLTRRAIAEMATRYGGHVVAVLAALGEVADPGTPAVLAVLTNGGLPARCRCRRGAGSRVLAFRRLPRRWLAVVMTTAAGRLRASAGRQCSGNQVCRRCGAVVSAVVVAVARSRWA